MVRIGLGGKVELGVEIGGLVGGGVSVGLGSVEVGVGLSEGVSPGAGLAFGGSAVDAASGLDSEGRVVGVGGVTTAGLGDLSGVFGSGGLI